MKGFKSVTVMIQHTATLAANRVRIPLAMPPPLFVNSPHCLQVCRFNALDINLFREDKGHDPQKIRESQRRRSARVDLVDQVIEHDKQWRPLQFELDNLQKVFNNRDEEVAKLKTAKQDASEMITQSKEIKKSISQKKTKVREVKSTLDSLLGLIWNLVHDPVPISDEETKNTVVRTWGESRKEPNLKNHVELVQLLGIADLKKGADVTGGGGYYLKGYGLLLNQALIKFGFAFLEERGYVSLQFLSFMRKEVMAGCAQLPQFDEELYKVIGEGDDKYFIAAAEQPLYAYHRHDWIHPTTLPIRYAGNSFGLRKEAGSQGKDTVEIFGAHEFYVLEQFCVTSPNGNESWDIYEEMMKNCEDFYKDLNIPYQIVAIGAGALNAAAAKMYELEAWFPATKTYRKLVSCSNCTDYLSRELEIRYGQRKSNEQTKQYVHLMNSTLTATEKTICCILENYQREDGVEIPKALRPFMLDIDFLPFTKAKKVDRAEASVG